MQIELESTNLAEQSVKLAFNTENGHYVAIMIIDKHMVIENNLMYQVIMKFPTSQAVFGC